MFITILMINLATRTINFLRHGRKFRLAATQGRARWGTAFSFSTALDGESIAE